MEFTINIKGLDGLAAAITALAGAIIESRKPVEVSQRFEAVTDTATQAPVQSAAPAQPIIPQQQIAPTGMPIAGIDPQPQQAAAPMAQATPAPTNVVPLQTAIPVQVAPVQPVQAAPLQPQQAAPIQQPVSQAPAMPVVPTAAEPQYTVEQIQIAATPLIDAGRGEEIRALLMQRYGVDALTALNPSYYPAFVNDLRQLGVKI